MERVHRKARTRDHADGCILHVVSMVGARARGCASMLHRPACDVHQSNIRVSHAPHPLHCSISRGQCQREALEGGRFLFRASEARICALARADATRAMASRARRMQKLCRCHGLRSNARVARTASSATHFARARVRSVFTNPSTWVSGRCVCRSHEIGTQADASDV